MFKEVIHILQKTRTITKKNQDFTQVQSNCSVNLHILLLWYKMQPFLLSKTTFMYTDFFFTYFIMIWSFIKNLFRIKKL